MHRYSFNLVRDAGIIYGCSLIRRYWLSAKPKVSGASCRVDFRRNGQEKRSYKNGFRSRFGVEGLRWLVGKESRIPCTSFCRIPNSSP